MTEIADILDQAATVIKRNGHHKGDYYDVTQTADGWPLGSDECRVCALGAIIIAAGSKPIHGLMSAVTPTVAEDAARAFAARLPQTVPYPRGDVIAVVGGWNDADERTDDDVIRELRACAASLREATGQ